MCAGCTQSPGPRRGKTVAGHTIWSRATARAIDLAISSGLFLAPRRVLLEMAAERKRQADEPGAAGEMELLKAA